MGVDRLFYIRYLCKLKELKKMNELKNDYRISSFVTSELSGTYAIHAGGGNSLTIK
jgi:hypothetical protein